MKKAIRYLRFSQLGQSNGSIERQEMYTDQWVKFNNVELVDTFIDRGKSAKTFDRPDFIKLQEFIIKHHRVVDFLLVDQMDRFSRNAGEAMSMVKMLQKKYSIQVVSVTEGITFDYDTPGSFFRAGLQLLLAEEDNINRSIKIRGGLYTARAKEGRYIGIKPPFGYIKQGEQKERRLVIEESEAKVIKFIYDSFLKNMPLYKIKEKAFELGFKNKGNTSIERVLTNPVYAGMLKVQGYKEYPGGNFPGIHEPIIDTSTWQMVQNKIKKPEKTRTVIDEELPLRGILKCHCSNPLTGAPSRGKSGKYFYYYKCQNSKHNNISVIKAHNQFLEICELMSLPKQKLLEIRSSCNNALEDDLKFKERKLAEKKQLLEDTKEKMFSLEEKWIKNEISKETYDRWHTNFNSIIQPLKGAIERLNQKEDRAFAILEKNIEMLTDLKFVYSNADIMQKREFVNLVFDSNLYYQEGIYRTPTMMNILSCNHLIMKEKGCLVYEKKRDDFSIIPSSGVAGNRTRVQTSN
ncbi:recombinase family protein [Flavobacterium sp. Fl-318]|uniref:Recombinase family protein n=1 Tax=Flavobacterium cupriresistens TaxID=2893885 RepID=A0ABU4R8L3_9FLAO|nr:MULTISPECIES: recombinase family protein [unclassified Flavobacterium]MDX6187840.1 recombinase family protein [Flavobacterium sp. Fl-318]UFH42239.1 recombinase family protein [Flavobacterium sp. F-323]